MSTCEAGGDGWHPGEGVVADRTDRVIESLLSQNLTKFRIRELDEAIYLAANVGSDPVVRKYRERVIRYGPFKAERPGVYRVTEVGK